MTLSVHCNTYAHQFKYYIINCFSKYNTKTLNAIIPGVEIRAKNGILRERLADLLPTGQFQTILSQKKHSVSAELLKLS